MKTNTNKQEESINLKSKMKEVVSEATEMTDILSSSLWKPLLLSCVYVVALRNWYFTFQAGGEGSGVFGTVMLEAPIVGSVLYLALIFGLKKWMQDRKPFLLKDYMFTYNLYQTILNFWCVCAIIKEVYTQNMSIWGNPVDTSPKGFRLAFLIWVHYNNKYVELLDTVFMALRKKNEQMTFLHMYHHILIMWAWYLVCKYACGGDAYFGMLCNSFVHVLMYSYYLFALLKINTPWKRWLTNIQLIQFAVCLSQAIYTIINGNYPVWLSCVQLWVMSNMLLLFGDFYRKTYTKKKTDNAIESKKD